LKDSVQKDGKGVRIREKKKKKTNVKRGAEIKEWTPKLQLQHDR